MIEIKEITSKEYNTLNNSNINQDHFKYYKIVKNNTISYFVSYTNNFHNSNQYLYPNFKFNLFSNPKEIFQSIRDYFNKPLQIIVNSKEIETINILKKASFKLKRKSYDALFKVNDLKNKKDESSIKLIDNYNLLYNKIIEYAYNHYVKTHKNISKLTANLEEFIINVPSNAYIEEKNGKILNYVFIEENELVYMGSNKLSSFSKFIRSVVLEMFNSYQEITFEADNTDKVAIKLKNIFKTRKLNSFDTYILK